jgi:putative hydrolase of the HAD superfamily
LIPKLVTFDCAETLVAVRWAVDGFAGDCMAHLGAPVTPEDASLYRRMYYERLPEFLMVNLRRDPIEGAAFWRRLAADWLARIGADANLLDPLQETADELGFGPDSILFRPYDDVLPCFAELKAMGIRLAVVSNWDYSLHRVLRMFGFDEHLELAVASLEEGVEKPDRRLFDITLDRLGVTAEETLHVGDNPEDDLQGARNAGIRGVLIDRSAVHPAPPIIETLARLPETFAWTD